MTQERHSIILKIGGNFGKTKSNNSSRYTNTKKIAKSNNFYLTFSKGQTAFDEFKLFSRIIKIICDLRFLHKSLEFKN